jgi:hypothetical protein
VSRVTGFPEFPNTKHQLDEELAILHQELGMDLEPRDCKPAQKVPVQEQPRERNGEWRERRPAV